MLKDAGNHLKKATAIAPNYSSVIRNEIGGNDPRDIYQMQFGQRSSFQAELSADGTVGLHLIQDRNSNGRIDRGEVLQRGRSEQHNTVLKADHLDAGTYFLRLVPQGDGTVEYRLNLSPGDSSPSKTATRAATTAPSRSAATTWNASFLNRDRNNLRDYRSYNFSRADATRNLGAQGKSGNTLARLNVNNARRSPAQGINRDRFAMEAWTRVSLEEGSFYRLSSKSDDGIRFYFKDAGTGRVVTQLAGDWRDRKFNQPAWNQVLTPGKSGNFDFYVQYFDSQGKSALDVSLERVDLTGQVVSSGLNVRSQPTSFNNNPIDYLNQSETFRVVKQVRSPNDTSYPNWYQIVTGDGQQGYVAADNSFVNLMVDKQIVSLGNVVTPPTPPQPPKPDVPGGGGTPGSSQQGVISSKVWITSDDKISLRSNKDISGIELARLGQNTSLTLVEKVTGGRYLNGFDEWFKVRTTVNGQSLEGYVAAYYVDVVDDGGRFETAISKENTFYKPHLNEATSPTHYWTSYKPYVDEVASKYSWLKSSIIGGIGSRESGWGLLLDPPGPGGTGDGGHGRGIMQIDDRFHQPFIGSGRWSNPKDNITYAVDEVLARNYDYLDRNTALGGLDLLRGAIASYNAGLGNVLDALAEGLDVDYYTTGQDYSWDVLNRAGWFQLHGWT